MAENKGDKKSQMRRYRERLKAKGLRTGSDPESSMRAWLAKCLRDRRVYNRKHNIPFNVDLEFVVNLFDKQRGRCAIGGMMMSHSIGDLRAASVDLIEEAVGHVNGNVQLVCNWISLSKGKSSEPAVRAVILDLKRLLAAEILDALAKKAAAGGPWPAPIEEYRVKS